MADKEKKIEAVTSTPEPTPLIADERVRLLADLKQITPAEAYQQELERLQKKRQAKPAPVDATNS